MSNLGNMATYQKVLESECLKSKVEERDLNHDLFKAKPGRTQLLVHRVSMRSDQDGSNNLALHLGETVADSSQIKALEKVRIKMPSNSCILEMLSYLTPKMELVTD